MFTVSSAIPLWPVRKPPWPVRKPRQSLLAATQRYNASYVRLRTSLDGVKGFEGVLAQTTAMITILESGEGERVKPSDVLAAGKELAAGNVFLRAIGHPSITT